MAIIKNKEEFDVDNFWSEISNRNSVPDNDIYYLCNWKNLIPSSLYASRNIIDVLKSRSLCQRLISKDSSYCVSS